MNTITPSQILTHCKKHGFPTPANLLPKVQPRQSVGSGDLLAISITLDLRTVSEANLRGKGGTRARMVRKKAQRNAVRLALGKLGSLLPALPVRVTLTRHGRKRLDDDNLAISLKAVRDGIADAYQVDDGSDQYRWEYDQVLGPAYAVEIRIERRET
jgi:hypothetical protein